MKLVCMKFFCAITFYGCTLFIFASNSSANTNLGEPVEESVDKNNFLRNRHKYPSRNTSKGGGNEKQNKVIRSLRTLLISPDLGNRSGHLNYQIVAQNGTAGIRFDFEKFIFEDPNVYDGSCMPSFFMIIQDGISTSPKCGNMEGHQIDVPVTEGSLVEILIVYQRFNENSKTPSWRILVSQIPSANVISNSLKNSENEFCGIKKDAPPTERTTTSWPSSGQSKAATWVDDDFDIPDCPRGKICGYSKKQFKTTANKIVNGREAKTWPWMVALGVFKDGVFKCFCGGAIIGRKYIATANHCVLFAYQGVALEEVFVAIRAHDLSQNEIGKEYIPVVKVIQHPQYYSVRHDMSLLELGKELSYDDKCGPICLPWETDPNLDSADVVITGWGLKSTSFFGGPSAVLMEAAVHCIPNANCSANWISIAGKDAVGLIEPFMVCCGGRSATCNGDSGSPVHMVVGNKWYLAGLVSFGSNYNCLDSVILSVMSRATSFMDWLALSTALPSTVAPVTLY